MSKSLVSQFEQKQLDSILAERKEGSFEEFRVGDTLSVGVKIQDLNGFRVQMFEGVCIARRSKGLRSNFCVRRVGLANESMVQTFLLNLSNIDSIKVVKKGLVRSAKLYRLKSKFGKAARIKKRA